MMIKDRDGTEYDGCDRCEFRDEDDYRRSEEGYHKAYNLDLCAGSFSAWIRCKLD